MTSIPKKEAKKASSRSKAHKKDSALDAREMNLGGWIVVVWLICICLGSTLIYFDFTEGIVPKMLSASGPVLIYAAFAWIFVWRQASKQQIQASFISKVSDSIYYIGFALTLAALMVALVKLGQTDANTKILSLLSNLGIALGTSAVGVICKMVFDFIIALTLSDVEFSLNTAATEEERNGVGGLSSDEVQNFTRGLFELVDQIKNVNASLRGAGSDSLAETIQGSLSAAAKGLQTTCDELGQKLSASEATSAALTAKISKLPEELEQALSRHTDDLQKTVSKMSENAQYILSAAALHVEKSTSTTASFIEAYDKRWDDANAKIAEITASSEAMTMSMAKMASQVEALVPKLTEFNQGVGNMHSLSVELQKLTSSVQQASKELTGLSSETSDWRAKLKTRLQEGSEKVTNAADEFLEGLRNIIQSLTQKANGPSKN